MSSKNIMKSLSTNKLKNKYSVRNHSLKQEKDRMKDVINMYVAYV